MFEIKFEEINSINHNDDFWAKRDIQMNIELNSLDKKNIVNKNKKKCKDIKQSKKKVKIIKKIEKEYEIINDNDVNLSQNE